MTDTAREQRLMIVANQTCPCPALIDLAHARVHPDGEILVVAPALNSRLRHLASDTDAAVGLAERRLSEAIQAFSDLGVRAHGEVGDADPLLAMQDAMRTFAAQAIIVSTHPTGHSHWLEHNLISRAQSTFDVPIVHVESRFGLASEATIAS